MSQTVSKGRCSTCSIRPNTIFAPLDEAELVKLQTFQPMNTLPNGKVHIVQLLRDGDFFGFGGFSGATYKHTAIALSPVEVCRMPMVDLRKLKQTLPTIEVEMTKRWLERLHHAESMLVELGTKKAGERLASFLLRWCAGGESQVLVPLPLNRAEIGELLGVTIETVSRFLADWKRQGYMGESQGSIQILDAAGLRKAMGIED